MGYRHYMYIVPCSMVEEIQGMTYSELKVYAQKVGCYSATDIEEWVDLIELIGKNDFFGFGKFYENAQNIQNLGTPLFSIDDTQRYFEEYAPYVVGRDAVLCAIEDYRQKIVNWYSSLLMTQEEFEKSKVYFPSKLNQEERIRRHLENQRDEWENSFGLLAIDTDEDSPNIVRSWLYEYEIFELVHRLKTMDWGKNTLVFMGW